MTKISTLSILQRFILCLFECPRAATLSCWAPCCALASVVSIAVTFCLFSPWTEGDTQQCYPAEGGLLVTNTLGSFGCANQLLLVEAGHHFVL